MIVMLMIVCNCIGFRKRKKLKLTGPTSRWRLASRTIPTSCGLLSHLHRFHWVTPRTLKLLHVMLLERSHALQNFTLNVRII